MDVAYSSAYLSWRLGEDHPSNPERARLAVDMLLARGMPMRVFEQPPTTVAQLEMVHDPAYVRACLAGQSEEWAGTRPDLGQAVAVMFGGTALLVDRMLSGETTLGFNPQGAKHHAHYDHSSGFCVFNDMAYAARIFTAAGMRVAYLDWDAHHGDGVEALTADNPAVMTSSIHNVPLFPGTGLSHDPENQVWNYPLSGAASGAEMLEALDDALSRAVDFGTDVVLLAAGADGHRDDPLSYLVYYYDDFVEAAMRLAAFARVHCDGRILVGGAGGYQPHTHTPAIWAEVVATLHHQLAPTRANIAANNAETHATMKSRA